MNRMNADEEDMMFMDMKWTAILQLAQEDWESKFSHILFFICVHPIHPWFEFIIKSPARLFATHAPPQKPPAAEKPRY